MHGDPAGGRRERARHVALLAVIPWLELFFNPNLFITPGGNGYIDPWLYTGFFVDLPGLMARFPGTYYGSRLSWLLPGHLAHVVFPPLAANYVLHLSFFYALIAGTYLLVGSAVNRRVGFLVALVVAWNPIVLTALSWDYVDGAGIVFVTLTLLCIEQAIHAGRGRMLWAAAAGAGLTCMVSSNLFLLIYWPLCGLFAVLRTGRDRWGDLPLIAIAAAIGAACALLAFGFANTRLGGGWLFLAPQIREGRSLAAAPNPWKLPGYSWLGHATWLVLPLTASVGAMLSVWPRFRPGIPFARAMQVMLLAGAALWIAVHAHGTPVLQILYYSSYLAPLALIALALQFSDSFDDLDRRAIVALELATLAIFVVAHWLVVSDVPGFWRRLQPWLGQRLPLLTWGGPYSYEQFSTAAGLLAGLAVAFAVRRTASPVGRWLLFAAGLAAMSTAAPPDLPSRNVTYTQAYFQETVAAHRFIEEHVKDHRMRIWSTDPRGTLRPIIGVASTYLWGYSLVNYELPSLKAEEAAVLAADTRLVFLTPRFEDVEQARAPLQRFGFEFDIIAQREFGKGALALAVVVANLR